MSVDSYTMELLLAAGKDTSDLLTVAYAMERGDDARCVYGLINDLEDAGTPPAAIGVAILALAEKINERGPQPSQRAPRDGYSSSRDGNRARRGIPDKEWRALRQRIFERDGHACTYCGSSDDLTCDHVIPLVRGGTNDDDNLTTACRPCNSSKGDRVMEVWGQWL